MRGAQPIRLQDTRRGILVASSRGELRQEILRGLDRASLSAKEASGGADALLKLRQSDFGTLLLDSMIEDLDTEELVATIHTRYPHVEVVLIDPADSPGEFLCGDCEKTSQRAIDAHSPVAEAARAVWSDDENSVATFPHTEIEPLPGMIGTSRQMQHVYRLARLIAPRNTSVLIVGATGTGKELIAHAIHELSHRAKGPFVVVNCAAIPETLLEAELFGFTRGAFTGAVQSRLGRIHAAHGGTLVLDEVGELPLGMQAKLLRFVQEGEVQRLGSADLFRVDARLVASTNADLLQRVREKQFREDLYYRLAVFPIDLPTLRERADDVVALAQRFLARFCEESELPGKVFSERATEALREYSWPGNVRELQHRVERAFVLADSRRSISIEDLDLPLNDAP